MLEQILVTSDGKFCDKQGRLIQLRGVNFDPTAKLPARPFFSTHDPVSEDSFEKFLGDNRFYSFVNHPVELESLEEHIGRLKALGYNTIRLPVTWEALEHEGPGKYDFEYIEYLTELLKIILKIGGIYVYLDPHQDVWSRFTGGSGAPIWTLHCAGLNPRAFQVTEAAILHNFYIDIESGEEMEEKKFPKMIWPTNYNKLACQTMFTLFFAGKTFAPKCIVNDQNIQDYLQSKFVNAFATLYRKIRDDAPEVIEQNCLIGAETLNEPSCGYIGEKNLSILPKTRQLRIGSTPTAFQSFILGEGLDATVEVYELSYLGPVRKCYNTINPKGIKAWLSAEERTKYDEIYDWKRGSEWEPNTCIWRQHGVWGIESEGQPKLYQPNYFSKICDKSLPKDTNTTSANTTIDEDYFTNNFFVQFYSLYFKTLRQIDNELFIFLQPPVLRKPPNLVNQSIVDSKTIYACHYYDGMSLMFKSWNKLINADTLGIMRNRYMSPAFSLSFGETNIRKSFKRQLAAMKEEGKKYLGPSVPIFFTEIGMPFDMDDKKAFKTGDYGSQTSALDALHYALESSNLSYSLWCYCSINSHKWGDNWNNENFSIWSADDSNTITCRMKQKNELNNSVEEPRQLKCLVLQKYNGFRALNAILRPFPMEINGTFVSAEFLLSSKKYTLKIIGKDCIQPNSECTVIFIPIHHFPIDKIFATSSSQHIVFDTISQTIKWHHQSGHQYLTIKHSDFL